MELELEKKKLIQRSSSSLENYDVPMCKDAECDTKDIHSHEINEIFIQKKNFKKNFLTVDEISPNLHNEIIKFTLEVEEFNQKYNPLFKELIEKITEAIQKVLPDSFVRKLKEFYLIYFIKKVSTYGSFETGLCLPYSDIDLVIQQNVYSAYPDPLSILEDSLKVT